MPETETYGPPINQTDALWRERCELTARLAAWEHLGRELLATLRTNRASWWGRTVSAREDAITERNIEALVRMLEAKSCVT